jgi:hypothetical protein
MFEMPDAVPDIAMVGNTDKIAKDELIYSGLFLNFAYSSYFDILALFAMAFREVPQAVAVYKKEIVAAVDDQSSGGVYILKLGAKISISCVCIFRGDIDTGEGVCLLEHMDQGPDIDPYSGVENNCVRIRERIVARRAYDDAALLEVDFMHFAIFAEQIYENKWQLNIQANTE